MKKLPITLLLLTLIAFVACKQPAGEDTAKVVETEEVTKLVDSPDYGAFDDKVAIIRSFTKAHGDEDLAKLSELMADTLKWSPPFYNGNTYLGKEDYLAVLKQYHDDFESISFTEGITLASGDVEPGFWSGSHYPQDKASAKPTSIRSYGTWVGTHTASGKTIGVKWFAIIWHNEDGKIAMVTEYFDVNGIAAQLAY